MPQQLRPGRFSLDGGPSYPGYTYGRTWNGWACPYFTKEVADQIAAPWNADPSTGMSATYDPRMDTYTFCDPVHGRDPETVAGESHGIGRALYRLYPIGNGSWVWDDETAP